MVNVVCIGKQNADGSYTNNQESSMVEGRRLLVLQRNSIREISETDPCLDCGGRLAQIYTGDAELYLAHHHANVSFLFLILCFNHITFNHMLLSCKIWEKAG